MILNQRAAAFVFCEEGNGGISTLTSAKFAIFHVYKPESAHVVEITITDLSTRCGQFDFFC